MAAADREIEINRKRIAVDSRRINVQKMQLLLITQDEVSQNKVLVDVRSLPRNPRPTVAGRELERFNPQVAGMPRIQLEVGVLNHEIVWPVSDGQGGVRKADFFWEKPGQFQSRFWRARPQRRFGGVQDNASRARLHSVEQVWQTMPRKTQQIIIEIEIVDVDRFNS